MDKFSYAIGLGIGQNLLGMGAKGIAVDDFAQAIKMCSKEIRQPSAIRRLEKS